MPAMTLLRRQIRALKASSRWFRSEPEPRPKRWKSVFEQMNGVFAEELQRRREHLASSTKLNSAIVVLLITNTIILGIEVDDQRAVAVEMNVGFVLTEIFFASVFILEWLVRLDQQRFEFFHDGWNVFDFSLVLMGFGDLMMTLFRPVAGVQLAKAFRVFRGLRVARSVKGVAGLGGLWFMIQGLLDSFRAVAFVASIAAVALYIFAVSMTSVVATDPIVLNFWPAATFYFGTIGQSMMTMLQVATLDRWAGLVARPLLELSLPAVVLLILGVVLLTFAIFNLLVAVMVKQITSLASDSKETSARMLINSERYILHRLLIEFNRHDQDNGYLSLREFKKMIRQADVQAKLTMLGLRVDEAEELFTVLDADQSGEVSAEELVDGIQQLKGPATGQDMVRLISIALHENWRAGCFVERLRRMSYRADEIQGRLNMMGHRLSTEIFDAKNADYRHDLLHKQAGDRDNVIYEMDQFRFANYPEIIPKPVPKQDQEPEPDNFLDNFLE